MEEKVNKTIDELNSYLISRCKKQGLIVDERNCGIFQNRLEKLYINVVNIRRFYFNTNKYNILKDMDREQIIKYIIEIITPILLKNQIKGFQSGSRIFILKDNKYVFSKYKE